MRNLHTKYDSIGFNEKFMIKFQGKLLIFFRGFVLHCIWSSHLTLYTRFCFKSLKIPTEAQEQGIQWPKEKEQSLIYKTPTQKISQITTNRFGTSSSSYWKENCSRRDIAEKIAVNNNYPLTSNTPYNPLSGQQMLSGTQIISTSHGMTGRNFFDVFLPLYLLFGF
jgi:hypothetical protein